MKRIFLSNGCSFSPPIVSPANWQSKKANTDVPWSIRYRFYDPIVCPEGRQFAVKDMNRFKLLEDRRAAAQELIRLLNTRLSEDEWNPITNHEKENELNFEVDPTTPVNEALQYAYDHKICAPKTRAQLRQVLKHAQLAIRELRYDRMAIQDIRRRHMRFVLDRIGKKRGGWGATAFNNFRAGLKMLFSELEEIEATEVDPISKIRKMQILHKIRKTLTLEERKEVVAFLRERYTNFHRFVQIFYHSGSRISELLRLKTEDVDLSNQRFKVALIKGRRRLEVWKTIKDLALPYWQTIELKPGQFVFSKKLEPGPISINSIQVTQRWRLLVKHKLGIEADLYSLKHSHTTEVVSLLSSKEAAIHNGHADETMVAKVYDIQHKERENNRIRGLNNPL